VVPPKTLALVSAVLLAAVLAGCSGQRGLEQTYGDVAEQDYFSSDGAFSFIAAANRQGSLQFSGELDIEGSWNSADYAGQPIVVNFWFAGCPPCRLEAEDLEALHQDFQADGVQFIGVNIFDGPETARTFADEFGVTYPSLMDANSG
jgi:Peroxiredoxin